MAGRAGDRIVGLFTFKRRPSRGLRSDTASENPGLGVRISRNTHALCEHRAAIAEASTQQRVAAGSPRTERIGQLKYPAAAGVEGGANEKDSVRVSTSLSCYDLRLAKVEFGNLSSFAHESLDLKVQMPPSALRCEVVAETVRPTLVAEDDISIAGDPFDVGVMTFQPGSCSHLTYEPNSCPLVVAHPRRPNHGDASSAGLRVAMARELSKPHTPRLCEQLLRDASGDRVRKSFKVLDLH